MPLSINLATNNSNELKPSRGSCPVLLASKIPFGDSETSEAKDPKLP